MLAQRRRKLKAAPPPRDVQIHNMEDEYVDCRAWGHNWRIRKGYGVKDPNNPEVFQAYWRWAQKHCDRCGMEVSSIWDEFFEFVTTSRKAPKGYDVVGGGHVAWRREAQQESFRRIDPPTSKRKNPSTA
jgi:hypothetical protein